MHNSLKPARDRRSLDLSRLAQREQGGGIDNNDRMPRRLDEMSTFPLAALLDLLRHMEWADATVWRALMAHPPSAGDTRLRELLLHVHGVQRSFLNLWRSEAMPLPAADGFPDLQSVHTWARSYYPEVAAWTGSLDEATLARPVEMPWLGTLEARMGRKLDKPTIAETMFQVTSHSTYHRGQVNVRLREVGGEPPLVDYIAWIWFGRPSPEWNMA